MARRKKLTPPERLKKAYETVMAFPEGVEVLRHMLQLSGYNDALLHVDPQSLEVNQTGTIVNVAKRDMWLNIRQYLKPEHSLRLEHADTALDLEPDDNEKEDTDVRE